MPQWRSETNEFSHAQTSNYDRAGLLISTISRLGDTVRYRYDAAGRKTAMIFPLHDYSAGCQPSPACVTALQVPGDSVSYAYNISGNLLTSKNHEGVISRIYYPDGSLKRKIPAFTAEIQMPGNGTTADSSYFENDVADVLLPSTTAGGLNADKNPFYGRVVYTHGPGLDQPLAVFRMGYTFALDSAGFAVTPAAYGLFTINPFWDRQGDAVLGAYANGKAAECRPISGNPRPACVRIAWPAAWSAYDREREMVRESWHGSLLENRRDPTGLQYRRNRLYDPSAGRFTQEDPIGLAGGINLYGFAASDPVNFSDPFGLCPPEVTGKPCGFVEGLKVFASNFGKGFAAVTAGGLTNFRDTGPGARSGAVVGTLALALTTRAPLVGGAGSLLGSGLGDLSVSEAAQIQNVVNAAGRPISVVGSAARGARIAGSDIDYVVSPSSLEHFKGLEGKLPGVDPAHGIIPGGPNPYQGPAIRFIPNGSPEIIREIF